MAYGSGAGSWLGVSILKAGQATWRTASPGGYVYFPMHPGGAERKEETQFSAQARGGDAVHGRSGPVSDDGSIVFDVYPHNLDYFLASIFPMTQANPGAGTIYEHTYTIPNLLQLPQEFGMTVREGLGTAASSDTMKEHLSAFVTGIQLSVANNFLVCSVTIMAAERSFGTLTPTFGVQVPFVVAGFLTVDLTTADATPYANIPVRGLSINLPAPLRMDYSDTERHAIKAARTEKIIPELTYNWDFSTSEPEPKLRTAWANKEKVQAVVKITGADLGAGSLELLQFTFPHLLRGGADPKVGGAGPIPSTFNFKAQRDIATGAAAVTILTRNNTNLT